MNLSPRDAHRRSDRLPLTSMIDVVFLLLIYFLVTASLSAAESELSSGLRAQKPTGAGSSDLQPQVVTVDVVEGAPAYVLGSRVMRTKGELTDVLAKLPRDSGVFVRGRSVAPVHAVATALQSAKDAGFIRITYVPAD